MNRLDKCLILKSKGYKYDPITGKIFGIRGNELKAKHIEGYILLNNGLLGHHFAWYMTYGNVDFIELDHINRVRDDNRIDNLRIVTSQQNKWNTNAKGYYFHKNKNKWQSQIRINEKRIYLGLFNTEEEAKNAYLIAKQKYHII
jgi:hypothetical protein